MEKQSRTIIDIYFKSKDQFYMSNRDVLIYFIVAIALLVGFFCKVDDLQKLVNSLLTTFIVMNSTFLAFTVAAFSFIYAFPRGVIVLLRTMKAEGYKWSYMRTILLTYVNIMVPCYISIVVFSILLIINAVLLNYYLNYAVFFIFVLTQVWVFICIRSFLFWIFDNSLMVTDAITKLELSEAGHTEDEISKIHFDES